MSTLAQAVSKPFGPVVAPKTLAVPANGDRGWHEAVNAGNYDEVLCSGFDPAKNFPQFPEGSEKDFTAHASLMVPRTGGIPPKPQGLTGEKWLATGKKFVHPLTFLSIGEHYPNEQLVCPMFTIWRDSGGQVWIALLGGFKGKRRLVVIRCKVGSAIGIVSELDEWGATSRAVIYSGE